MNNPIPIHIEYPCINIIGTIQTKLVHELFKKGYKDNGFLDRMLFVLPKTQKISEWIDSDEEVNTNTLAAQRWATILDKVQSLEYNCQENEEPKPTILKMDKEAKTYFYDWRNSAIRKVDETPNDQDVKNRVMKQPNIVAKLSLIMQVIRWACGESHLQYVDLESVKRAVRIDEFFEENYSRIEERVATESLEPQQSDLLDLLPSQFETKQATAAGAQQGMAVRTVMNYLSEMTKAGVIKKVKHGVYHKLFAKDNE